MHLKARIHPIWIGGKTGYVYSVLFNGTLLVERSRDPEHDAARALLAQGIAGKLTLCDGKTGIPRTIIDIEKAAKLTVRENGKQFCNAQWKPFEGVNVEGYSLETA
jgi:hypothetical protein